MSVGRATALACVATVLLAGCMQPGNSGEPFGRHDGPNAGPQRCADCPEINPEVWADNRAWGPTYEFKVNCGPKDQSEPLESCFLWDLDEVTVESPNGTIIALDKDFNINDYSGEVTQRWVIYGPDGGGLPEVGDYTFRYFDNDTVRYEQTVQYDGTIIGWPTDITHEQNGDDLQVTWTPPAEAARASSYKILAFPESGGVYSKLLDADASSGVLDDLPFAAGEEYLLRVSIYWGDGAHGGGYATGPQIWETWQ